MTIDAVQTEDGSNTGDNFENGVIRATLAAPLQKALRTHNEQNFSVPTIRTRLRWTDGTGGVTETTVLLKKRRVSEDVVASSPGFAIGDVTLRLCPNPKASTRALGPGMTAEWGRESWAFLPLTSPDDSRLTGQIHARTGLDNRDNGGAVQAYNCRRVHIDAVIAETVPDPVPPPTVPSTARLDRAVILTTTRDATVGSATVRTPRHSAGNRRSWAVDMQHSSGTVVQTARIEDGRGGGVQFEQTGDEIDGVTVGETVGQGRPLASPALDVTLVPLDESMPNDDRPLGAVVEATYTALASRVGPVRIAPAGDAPAASPTDVFERTRYTAVGIFGEPTARDPRVDLEIDALDLGVEAQLVRPYFLADPGAQSGAGRFIYRTGDASSQATVFEATAMESLSGSPALPAGTTNLVVVPVVGVPRRITAALDLPINKRGTGAALVWHRQGGSVLAAGALAPEQSLDADAALQVYTGLGWRPYGYLVAVPGPEGWPPGTLDWSAEAFVDGSQSVTPPSIEVETRNASLTGATPDLPLPTGDARFLVGLQVQFIQVDAQGNDTGQILFQTGGRMTLSVTPKFGATGSLSRIDVVSGPNVEQTAGFVDLSGTPAALVAARGVRGYFPANTANRRLVIDVTTTDRPGDPFGLNVPGPHRLRVTALLSK